MSDAEENDIPMAECGSCRAIIPLDSKDCPECGISFSGVSDEALGECGACNSLVPLDSKSCPECGVYFVADEVLDVLRDWFNNTGIDAKVLFAKFDSDSDGSIDADELRDGLLKLNLADLPPSQIDRLISEVDDDEDGVISLEELVTAINGDESPEDDKSDDDKAESKLQYSENVVQRVMEKFEISDKDEFLLYAKQFDENENDYLTEAELKSAAESYIAEQSKNESNKEIIETEAGTNESVIEEDDLDVEEETVDESDELDESTESSTEQVVSEDEEDGSTSDEVDDSIVEDVEPDNLDAQDEDLTAEDYLGILLDAAQEQNLTIRAIFESMDLDDDGVIDGPELQSGINEIAGEYLSPGEIMSIISLVDKDSDGRVNALE
ncbi:MAG: EF-hand domain-containing protein, partial [Candidatus Poseidoniaceae archaeon]